MKQVEFLFRKEEKLKELGSDHREIVSLIAFLLCS